MDQFVVLGAGYDTRAYGEMKRDGLDFFELDQASMQEAKVASLDKAGIDAAHVTFVSIDFSREGAFDKLREAGYDPTKKTLFLWEGVTLYLAEEDVRKTLRDVREQAGPGSVLVADIYSQRMIKRGSGFLSKKALEYTGETLGFGLSFATDYEQNLERFLESEGLKPGETFFMGHASDKGPFVVVAEIRRLDSSSGPPAL